jgi:hypothetical protein
MLGEVVGVKWNDLINDWDHRQEWKTLNTANMWADIKSQIANEWTDITHMDI